jgi:hypothetical protein
MYLPRLPYVANNKAKKSTIIWGGLNRTSLIADNEFPATFNLSTDEIPLISPRKPRKETHTLTAGHALFSATKLAWVDGTSFVYDGYVKGTVSASAKSIIELSGTIVIFPDKKYYDTIEDEFNSFGSGTYPEEGSVPDIDYATVLDNRVWAVKGDNIYASALGDYSDWTSFLNPDGTVNEAGAYHVDTGSNGDFTGIASYKGTIIIFKNDRVWKLFGDVPTNFQFIEISRLGCIDHKSICEVNNILFWLSPQGVVSYTGGVPEVIGENLNDNYLSGAAGGDGRKYYISLYNGIIYALYVYDTWKNIWMREDDLRVVEFALNGGYLYALTYDNKILKFGSGDEKVVWSFTTKEFTEEIDQKKGHSELSFRIDLEESSTISVYVRKDNGSFEFVRSYSSNDLSSFTVPLKIKNADHFQIMVEGNGPGKVYQMTRKFYVAAR